MKPLASDEIKGTWGTVLLPLNRDDSIDFGALQEEVEAMLAAGLDGVYTNGTAGEFHTQTEDEFDRVSQLVAELCSKHGTPFQLGASHMSAQISRERALRARTLAPSAIQIILPDWVPISPVEAESFLRVIEECAQPVGLVLYAPGHAKRPLDLKSIARLRAAVPGLVGVKMPDGNSEWYETMRQLLPGFSVFVPGHHLATGWIQGASGSYSNVACLQPRGAGRWQALMKTDSARALAFEQKLLAFFAAEIAPLIQSGYAPLAIDKALCAAGGWCTMPAKIRWPYRALNESQLKHLGATAREALPELWEWAQP